MAIHQTTLRDGDAGVEDTICLMRKFSQDYSKNSSVKTICRQLKGKNDGETIKNLFLFITKTMHYVKDPETVELVKSPKHTIIGNSNYGDCDDLSTALVTLLLSAGYKCWFRTVAWRPSNPETFTHVYVVVEVPNQGIIIPLDPTMGDQGFGKEVKWIRKKDWSASDDNATCWVG